MMALINTLTNCSLTNYSLRKKIYKEEIKTEKGLEKFFFFFLVIFNYDTKILQKVVNFRFF